VQIDYIEVKELVKPRRGLEIGLLPLVLRVD